MSEQLAGPSTSARKRSRSSRDGTKVKANRGKSASTSRHRDVESPVNELLAQDDDREPEPSGDEDEEGDDENGDMAVARSLKDSDRKAKKAKRRKQTPGIVYISRLPPGMTPQKVRHLMARWGEVGKVYAQRRDAPTGYNPNAATQRKAKHQRADFTEAWVEFLDKSLAKTVAQMLNAQTIGGKKGDRWRDDVWTMKYLSGFKWEMLGEQVAYEKQAHQARLRNEIARSKTEQSEYLKNVELARVLDKRKQRKIDAASEGKGGALGSVGAKAQARADDEKDKAAARKGYTQRQAIDRTKALPDTNMAGVLGSVFS